MRLLQSTAGQILTIPAPTTATTGRLITVINRGSVTVTVIGTLIPVGSMVPFLWDNASSTWETLPFLDQDFTIQTISTTPSTLSSGGIAALVDATASNIVLNIPLASANTGKVFLVQKTDSTVNSVTLTRQGGDLIDGQTTYTVFNQSSAVFVISDGTNWHIMSDHELAAPSTTYTSTSVTLLPKAQIALFNNSATTTCNLPSALLAGRSTIFLKKVSIASFLVNIVPNGADTIDGTSPYILYPQYDGVLLRSDGISSWSVVTFFQNPNYTQTFTISTTLTARTQVVQFNNTSNVVCNLPAISTYPGGTYLIKKIISNAFTVTIDPNAAETIDGALTLLLTNQYDAALIKNDGISNWNIVAFFGTSGTSAFSQIKQTITANTTAGSATNTNYFYDINGAFTLTLPDSTTVGSNQYTVERIGAGTASIASTAGQLFNGVAGPINFTVQYSSASLTPRSGGGWTY